MKIEDLVLEIANHMATDPKMPLGSRPVFQLSSTAEVLIIGPAPGTRAYKTGIPWNDRSGDRLRSWLALSKEQFYDKSKIAIMPISFTYPGLNKYGGDNPPGIEHAELWHKPLLLLMPNIKLKLLVGFSAQSYYLKERAASSLTETVQLWKEYLPEFMVLPHPSWRNNAWIKKNQWFEAKLVPELRERVHGLLK